MLETELVAHLVQQLVAVAHLLEESGLLISECFARLQTEKQEGRETFVS